MKITNEMARIQVVNLKELVKDLPIEPISNMREVARQEWTDPKAARDEKNGLIASRSQELRLIRSCHYR
jgi:hypothetical protein